MDENNNVLSKADLQQMVERASGNLAQLMAQQNTALVLLGGTMSAFMTANSGILGNALGTLMTQSGLMHTQLDYNQTALDSASQMQMLINTLSGNIEGMLTGLEALGGYGESMSGNLEKIAPLVDQIANSGGGINDVANTAFGAISALGSWGSAVDTLKGLGGALAGAGKVAGIAGKLGALAPMVGAAAPLLIGGLAVAGVGTIAYKAYKNHQAKKEAQAADSPITERSIMDPIALEDTENARNRTPSLTERPPITERSMMDPVVLGTMDDMFAAQQARAADGGLLPTAAGAQHDRLVLADAALLSEISGLTQVMQKVADKPFDPNMRAEVIIQRLYGEMTQPELDRSIEKRFMDDWRGSGTPRRL